MKIIGTAKFNPLSHTFPRFTYISPLFLKIECVSIYKYLLQWHERNKKEMVEILVISYLFGI